MPNIRSSYFLCWLVMAQFRSSLISHLASLFSLLTRISRERCSWSIFLRLSPSPFHPIRYTFQLFSQTQPDPKPSSPKPRLCCFFPSPLHSFFTHFNIIFFKCGASWYKKEIKSSNLYRAIHVYGASERILLSLVTFFFVKWLYL